jgi:hypothetical protein
MYNLIKNFFKWVTDSIIKTSSISVEVIQLDLGISKTDGVTIEKIDLTKSEPSHNLDDNFVVLNG